MGRPAARYRFDWKQVAPSREKRQFRRRADVERTHCENLKRECGEVWDEAVRIFSSAGPSRLAPNQMRVESGFFLIERMAAATAALN
jgi:hypothetical protein